MKRIGILSDTHGTIPPQVYTFFRDCDELWHAGDIGPGVLEPLREFKPIRAVWGNCDSFEIYNQLPEYDFFICDGLRVLMMHICGSPGHYRPQARRQITLANPDILVCGHSHILKVVRDSEFDMLYINPGAAGRQGLHRVCTLVRFVIDGHPKDMEVMDFEKNV